ncbi:MAG: CvpA family protein [Deltaproteobacteria bacterium]|nr:CvpA family protein [Deltaproteobacteria bacterium]
MSDGTFTWLDGAVLVVLVIAMLRGLFIGLIREGFSIASVAAGVLAARIFTAPAAELLVELSEGEISAGVAPWIMGTVLAITTIAVVALIGRVLRRGARLVGLSWADRIGGAALGTVEGVVIAMVVVLGASWIVGRAHPQIAASRSLEAYDIVRTFVDENRGTLPDVAAPADWYEQPEDLKRSARDEWEEWE